MSLVTSRAAAAEPSQPAARAVRSGAGCPTQPSQYLRNVTIPRGHARPQHNFGADEQVRSARRCWRPRRWGVAFSAWRRLYRGMSSSWIRCIWLAAAAALMLTACGSSPPPPSTADDAQSPADEGASTSDDEGATEGRSSTQDAPEISRSQGKEGGVVVFWPRVIPRTDDVEIRRLAGKLQDRLTAVVKKAVPNAEVDVRPEPERVCQRAGCAGMTVGVLLTASGGGCVALALVSPPGPSPQHIVPWVGDVELKTQRVDFREPPENSVTVKDMESCDKLLDKLGDREADIVKAIQEAAPGS